MMLRKWGVDLSGEIREVAERAGEAMDGCGREI